MHFRLTGPYLATALSLAAAQVSAQSLTIGLAAAPTSADPHFHAVTPNAQFRRHIFEGLVAVDADNRPVPELAEAWEKVYETVWRFRLRPGVVFHDGTPFTARDVVYSFCRVPNISDSPGMFTPYLASVADVRVVDDLTVEIETSAPAPFLPDDLANIGIVSAAAAGGVPETLVYNSSNCGISEWPATADFNAARSVAVGTGPFRLVSFSPSDDSVLERFDGYWGDAPAFEQVVMRILTNSGARVSSLLSGTVDLIERPSLESLDQIVAAPGLTVTQAPTANIIYMSFDQELEPSPMVEGTDGRNPLMDVRVRTAMSMAINRAAIVERILYGRGLVASQMAAPSMFGFNTDIAPEAYDPQAARALLAEAGYPNGFRLTLHTPAARYQYDVEVAQAIAQMLTRIGIETSVEAVPPATYFTSATRQEFSFFLAGVGANMGESLMLLRALAHTRAERMGGLNRGRYSNPELDALIVSGLSEMDDARREELSRQALAIFTRDRGVLPIHQEMTLWAMRTGLGYAGRADQMLLAQSVTRD